MIDLNTLDFSKQPDGLIPAIIQDYYSGQVRMLGYMNADALHATVERKLVTFFSRSRQTLWTKGETSGNVLNVIEISPDCDRDALIISVIPAGPTCHTGSDSCFNGHASTFFDTLNQTIQTRIEQPTSDSYISKLLRKGIEKVAQKIGEEGVETVIETLREPVDQERLTNEIADLLFHTSIAMHYHDISMSDVIRVLHERHRA